MSIGILAKPPGPWLLRTCPSCGKAKFLQFKSSESHPIVGKVDTYVCKFCGRELTFGRELPSHVV